MSKNLVEYLQRCDDAYYNTSNPIVSDSTYDALVETLRRLDPSNPYLKKVGARVTSNKVGRLVPMGTLSKYHTDEEILKWLDSERGSILVSPKYDGFAVELTYHNGLLMSASTRGDGHVGEDVLTAMMKVQSVPIRLTEYNHIEYITVRGEAIIPTKNHEEAKKLGYQAMRNAVPGIVRSGRVDALGLVDFVAYEFIDGYVDRVAQREFYAKDFTVEDYHVLSYMDIEAMQRIRSELRDGNYSYELDGVVLKTAIIQEDDLLNPTHMIAWKYKSNRQTTTLREIEFNVGATGAISVVGIFDPVEFQGATLTRASFGSLSLYREMRPCVGDLIEVSRRGDIIPWIEGVVLSDPDNTYIDQTVCPCCGTELSDDKCINKECPDRVKLKLLQYIQGTKTKGLGQSLVKALVDAGMIKSLSDIYDLDPALILSLPRQGQSVVDKWITLQEKRLSPLEFLCAYPIENSGEAVWKALLSKYPIKDILSMTEEDMLSAKIRGLGESKVKSIVSQISECREDMLNIMERLGL